MKIHKATLAILVLIVAAFFYYDHTKTQEIQSSLESLTKDRDALKRQVSDLTLLAVEAKEREAAPPRAAELPRSDESAAKLTQRIDEPPVPGVTRTAPAGWAKNGSKPGAYVVGVDRNQTYAGMPSAYVKSIESSVNGFGGMMQMSSAEDFAGKRVRLSGWAKTQDANDGGGHVWLRVDGQQVGASLQFDNMDNRPIKGTTDWQPYSVVLDVPAEASALAYGFFVQGTGQMWVSGTKIEPVGADVSSTNMKVKKATPLPKTPTNLSFNPDLPK
jgi:hypothetical protein